jgi:hypothetical protein
MAEAGKAGTGSNWQTKCRASHGHGEDRPTAGNAFTAPKAKYRNFAPSRLFFTQHWQPRVDIERNGALHIGELKAAPK